MDKESNSNPITHPGLAALSDRWRRISLHAQVSPFENLSISCLAKNTSSRRWSRSGLKAKSDTLARYIYLSFEELLEIEQLDLKAAIHLLEICEGTMLFAKETDNLQSQKEFESQAALQRTRFVNEFGLYHDYPIALSNFKPDLMELCKAEEVLTLIDLMSFIDRLTDKTSLSGNLRDLQKVFAHGDEQGICKFFPYRLGHRGFHLPEALSFCLNRLPPEKLNAVCEYHKRLQKKKRFSFKSVKIPEIVETILLPDILQCLHYFGHRQERLMVNLQDSSYITRELMFLNDPQTEDILNWLLDLALGIFRPSMHKNVDEDLNRISVARKKPTAKSSVMTFNKKPEWSISKALVTQEGFE